MSKICAVCGEPLESGVVVHKECLPRWIPVTEKMPEEHPVFDGLTASEQCLVLPKSCMDVGFYNPSVARTENGKWNFGMPVYFSDDVTHWMPLPEPPEVE